MGFLFRVSSNISGNGRKGSITISHGEVRTPVFMPVGTQGSVIDSILGRDFSSYFDYEIKKCKSAGLGKFRYLNCE